MIARAIKALRIMISCAIKLLRTLILHAIVIIQMFFSVHWVALGTSIERATECWVDKAMF